MSESKAKLAAVRQAAQELNNANLGLARELRGILTTLAAIARRNGSVLTVSQQELEEIPATARIRASFDQEAQLYTFTYIAEEEPAGEGAEA